MALKKTLIDIIDSPIYVLTVLLYHIAYCRLSSAYTNKNIKFRQF